MGIELTTIQDAIGANNASWIAGIARPCGYCQQPFHPPTGRNRPYTANLNANAAVRIVRHNERHGGRAAVPAGQSSPKRTGLGPIEEHRSTPSPRRARTLLPGSLLAHAKWPG